MVSIHVYVSETECEFAVAAYGEGSPTSTVLNANRFRQLLSLL